MADEKKQAITIQNCIDMNTALNGRGSMKGVLQIQNITQGKYSIGLLAKQIKGIIEDYSIAYNAILEKYYQKEGKEFKRDEVENQLIVKDGMTVEDADKEYEEFLASDCGVTLPTIFVSFLEKIPEVTPEHIQLLMPILVESK